MRVIGRGSNSIKIEIKSCSLAIGLRGLLDKLLEMLNRQYSKISRVVA